MPKQPRANNPNNQTDAPKRILHVELALLNRGSTNKDIIPHFKPIFAKFGIPEEVMSYGGPQFLSFAFQTFAKHYGFHHTLSSPRYAQSNREAERGMRTVKNLLKKSQDPPYLALLAY